MPQPLTARVTPDGATSFEATITNLTPSSLFLRAPCDLSFRQSVALELGAVTLYGEVAFVCHEPPGAVVVFRATAEDLHTLEDHMDEAPVVEGGEPWTPLSDEDPTNPAAKVLASPTNLPESPRGASELGARMATVVSPPASLRSRTDQAMVAEDPTDPPTVDGVTASSPLADAEESQDATLLEDASKFSPRSSLDQEITGPAAGTKDDHGD